MQNNQSIMQISENKDGSAKVLFRIRKAEMTDVDEIMAVMHEAKNDKEHPDWFVSDDEEYVRTHIEEQGFVIVAQTADGSVAGFFIIKYPENREDNLGTYLDFDEEQLSHVAVMDSAVVLCIQGKRAAGAYAGRSGEIAGYRPILLSDVHHTSG